MTENNPIELKSTDGLAQIIAAKGEPNFEPSFEEKIEGEKQGQAAESQEEKKAEEGSQQQEGAQGGEPDFDKIIAEKTGGKFKSLEDLQAIITEKEKPKAVEVPTFEDDYEKLIWAAAQKGDVAKIKEITKLQNSNVDALKEADLLRLKMKQEMSGLSDDEIEDELYERYGYGLQPLTDEEKGELSPKEVEAHEKAIARAERMRKNDASLIKDSLKKDSDKTKNALLEEYKDVFEPKVEEKKEEVKAEEAPGKKEEQAADPTPEELQAMRNRFEANIKKVLPEVSKISIKDKVEIQEGVDQELELNYELSDADTKELIEYLANYVLSPKEEQEFVKEENGETVIDLKGLIQSKAPQIFADKIQKIRDREIAARAREYVIKKDLKRVDLTPGENTERGANLSTGQQEFLKQWANQIIPNQ